MKKTKLTFCNIAESIHSGNLTKMSSDRINSRFLLGKFGQTTNAIAVANSADIPLGIITDEAEAKDEPVNVAILGVSKSTLNMVAAEDITAGKPVYSSDNGKVRHLPETAGTYYEVGLALTSCTANQITEVASCLPRKVIVA